MGGLGEAGVPQKGEWEEFSGRTMPGEKEWQDWEKYEWAEWIGWGELEEWEDLEWRSGGVAE